MTATQIYVYNFETRLTLETSDCAKIIGFYVKIFAVLDRNGKRRNGTNAIWERFEYFMMVSPALIKTKKRVFNQRKTISIISQW